MEPTMEPVNESPSKQILFVLLSDRSPESNSEQGSRSSIDRFIQWTRDLTTANDVTIQLGVSLCLAKPADVPRYDGADGSAKPTLRKPLEHTYYYRESDSGMSALLDYASRNILTSESKGKSKQASQIFHRFEHIADARICMERNPDPDKENTSNPITTTTIGTYSSMDAFPLEEHLDDDEFFYFDSEYHTPNYRNTLVRVNLNNNDLYGLLYYRDPHVHTYKKRVHWREFLKLPGTFLNKDQICSMFSRWFFLNQLTKEHGDTFIEDTYEKVVFVTESMFDDAGMSAGLTQEVANYLFSVQVDTSDDMVITSFDSDTSLMEEPDDEDTYVKHGLWIPKQFDADTAVTHANVASSKTRTPRSHSLVVTSRTFATPYLRFFEECMVLHGNLYFMKMHTETIETDKQWDLNDVMELYLAELEAGRNGRAM